MKLKFSNLTREQEHTYFIHIVKNVVLYLCVLLCNRSLVVYPSAHSLVGKFRVAQSSVENVSLIYNLCRDQIYRRIRSLISWQGEQHTILRIRP